ncbi:MAG: hypothetical protein ABI867_12705 [Kofleriaceae bacterium]
MEYAFAPLFCVRLAGVPFEILESLGSPELFELARGVVAAETALDREAEATLALGRDLNLARAVAQRLRRAVSHRRAITEAVVAEAAPGYAAALTVLETARRELVARFAVADAAAREQLTAHAQGTLPDYLVFESVEALKLLRRRAGRALADTPSVRRNHERHYAMYLQRVCAKNDTISRFGPTSWGTVVEEQHGVSLDPRPGVTRRDVSVERWVVSALVAAINADPVVRAELCPRRHTNGRLEGTAYVRADEDRAVPLSSGDLELLARIDGTTPAHALDTERLGQLADSGVIRWELELVAWDATPLATLRADLAGWRDGEPRTRWLAEVDALVAITRQFATELDAEARLALVQRVSARCIELGGTLPIGRTLYKARNPIIEECERTTNLVLGGDLAAALTADIGPWIDLFRDTIALAATHCFERVRQLHASAPRRDGKLVLAAFVAHCEANDFAIRGAGLSRIARLAFDICKREFRDVLGGRADAREWVIDEAACRVLRDRHAVRPAEEFSLVSPDLQLAASSPEAVARGDYQWIVAELHTMITPLQRCLDWSCNDPELLRAQYRGAAMGRSWVVPSRAGFFATSVHTSPERLVEYVPGFVFAAPERAKPAWRSVAPSEVEVVVDEASHDIRVRSGDGEDLGSLLRTPWLAMGIHPFFPLELAPHTPRLRIGKTIVQRETWHVTWDELHCQAPDANAPELLVAIERLRAVRGIPRFVYVRPSTVLVERVEIFGRDKDVKPIYVDLESTIFADIFLRRLHEYKQLEVVEMSPAPDQLLWREPDGRYCFELRTMMPTAPGTPRR